MQRTARLFRGVVENGRGGWEKLTFKGGLVHVHREYTAMYHMCTDYIMT